MYWVYHDTGDCVEVLTCYVCAHLSLADRYTCTISYGALSGSTRRAHRTDRPFSVVHVTRTRSVASAARTHSVASAGCPCQLHIHDSSTIPTKPKQTSNATTFPPQKKSYLLTTLAAAARPCMTPYLGRTASPQVVVSVAHPRQLNKPHQTKAN